MMPALLITGNRLNHAGVMKPSMSSLRVCERQHAVASFGLWDHHCVAPIVSLPTW